MTTKIDQDAGVRITPTTNLEALADEQLLAYARGTYTAEAEAAMRKEMEKFFEDEVFAPMRREDIKTTEQLLFEFENGSLTEVGMILLVERGCREELLSRCSSVEERESVWLEFVLADQVKEYIANEKVISKEEVASAIVTAEMKAAKLARDGKES